MMCYSVRVCVRVFGDQSRPPGQPRTYLDVIREFAADAQLDGVARVGPQHRRGPRHLPPVKERGGRSSDATLWVCMCVRGSADQG